MGVLFGGAVSLGFGVVGWGWRTMRYASFRNSSAVSVVGVGFLRWMDLPCWADSSWFRAGVRSVMAGN